MLTLQELVICYLSFPICKTGASNGQRAASNNKDVDGGIVMGTNIGQEVMNEFKVNDEDRTTDHEDPNNQLPYGSPLPLLNQTR